MEQKILFSFNDNVNKQFLKNIPGIGSNTFLGDTVITKASSIKVYKASYREKYVEKDYLLDITELNDSTKIPFADYIERYRYSQEMYLLKYQFEARAKKRPNARLHTIDAMLFFSLKLDKDDFCIGFGPSYFGIIDYSFGYTSFPMELNIKKDKGTFYLKPARGNKTTGGYLFFMSGLAPDNSQDILNIQKIIKLDINKIGSYKPLVFNIPQILHDSNALQFHYDTTLRLIQ
ncbi:MAG: hypothetical protein ABIO55_12340 [Ginsengibacter sp.]